MPIWTRVVRCGAVAVFSATILLGSGAPASGAVGTKTILAEVGMDAGAGSGALRAPMSQSANTPNSPTETDAADGASRLAAMVAVLNQHSIRVAGNLARVSAVAVPNVTSQAEFVVDARVERALAASAATASAAIAEAEAARSAQEAVEAQAASDAITAANLAAAQKEDAEAATQAAQLAAASATQDAQAAATREAEASAAAATARADALAVAAEANNRQFLNRVTLAVIALVLLAGGVLGFKLWRNRKEPFVLKAIQVSLTADAHA